MVKYQTILADPPWRQPMMGKYKREKAAKINTLPYPTMSLSEIKALPVAGLTATGCHLWLWTTNAFLRQGFDVMKAWGFKYLAPIHWIKPSGFGNYFLHRTQTLLFGYKDKCHFRQDRFIPNIFQASPGRHSQKPPESYELIERVSQTPRLELFARNVRPGWHVWGNEVKSNPQITQVLEGKE